MNLRNIQKSSSILAMSEMQTASSQVNREEEGFAALLRQTMLSRPEHDAGVNESTRSATAFQNGVTRSHPHPSPRAEVSKPRRTESSRPSKPQLSQREATRAESAESDAPHTKAVGERPDRDARMRDKDKEMHPVSKTRPEAAGPVSNQIQQETGTDGSPVSTRADGAVAANEATVVQNSEAPQLSEQGTANTRVDFAPGNGILPGTDPVLRENGVPQAGLKPEEPSNAIRPQGERTVESSDQSSDGNVEPIPAGKNANPVEIVVPQDPESCSPSEGNTLPLIPEPQGNDSRSDAPQDPAGWAGSDAVPAASKSSPEKTPAEVRHSAHPTFADSLDSRISPDHAQIVEPQMAPDDQTGSQGSPASANDLSSQKGESVSAEQVAPRMIHGVHESSGSPLPAQGSGENGVSQAAEASQTFSGHQEGSHPERGGAGLADTRTVSAHLATDSVRNGGEGFRVSLDSATADVHTGTAETVATGQKGALTDVPPGLQEAHSREIAAPRGVIPPRFQAILESRPVSELRLLLENADSHVMVRMEMDGDKVRTVLVPENKEAYDTLQRQAPSMKQHLQDAGVPILDLSVSMDQDPRASWSGGGVRDGHTRQGSSRQETSYASDSIPADSPAAPELLAHRGGAVSFLA